MDSINNDLENQIKMMLYKRDNKIFEVLDFENEKIYKEPLLLLLLIGESEEEKATIKSVLYGYSERKIEFEVFSDNFGRVYLPNVGWFLTENKNQTYIYESKKRKLFKNKKEIPFEFEGLEIIKGTEIELLKYPIPLLQQIYKNRRNKLLDVEIEDITKKQIKHLTLAYNLIKKHVPTQFELIEKHAPKCVVFKTDPNDRNSFANKKAHGIAFFNAYQTNYNEVFFVEDIAHQTGHIILNNFMHNSKVVFIIDENQGLKNILNIEDSRSFYILYHSHYTYYSIFLCLNNCIENDAFDLKQKKEAIARIGFYLIKCTIDLKYIEDVFYCYKGIHNVLTPKGIEIHNHIKEKYQEVFEKWHPTTQNFDYSNQPYNFTYSKFLELNPLK
jgi:hypothetical protein